MLSSKSSTSSSSSEEEALTASVMHTQIRVGPCHFAPASLESPMEPIALSALERAMAAVSFQWPTPKKPTEGTFIAGDLTVDFVATHNETPPYIYLDEDLESLDYAGFTLRLKVRDPT